MERRVMLGEAEGPPSSTGSTGWLGAQRGLLLLLLLQLLQGLLLGREVEPPLD